MVGTFEYEYEIGTIVYHVIEENKRGIILDVTYNLRANRVSYKISFGSSPNDEIWCDNLEISDTPSFN